jgi:hypothetical protein
VLRILHQVSPLSPIKRAKRKSEVLGKGLLGVTSVAEGETQAPRQCERPTFDDYMAETFAACKPLGPFVTSNSTACPSFRDL